MARRKREVVTGSLSFLDVIACGFGAIILLLVITKTAEPMIMEETRENLDGLLANLEQQLFDIRGEATVLNRELTTKVEQRSEIEERLARLLRMLTQIRSQFESSGEEINAVAALEEQLKVVRQELNEAQEKFAYKRKFEDTTIGGIPVDSEYVIFIIDTSGSMYNFAWDLVLEKIRETLDVYPSLKGIQVMNDMGEYMFPRFANKWIPDTPARRQAIIERLRSWNAFSNSSPEEGITRAVSTFYAPDKAISLYIFGDEFSSGSIDALIKKIRKINRVTARGNRLVRIHAVGFPVQFLAAENFQRTGVRFATLMRILTHENGGTFVGLNSHQPR